jgi:hypothetical protein
MPVPFGFRTHNLRIISVQSFAGRPPQGVLLKQNENFIYRVRLRARFIRRSSNRFHANL